MIKRVIFYVLCLTLLVSGLTFVYYKYKPEDTSLLNKNYLVTDSEKTYTLEQFNQYINENPNTNIFAIFYKNDDINSQYLINDILPEIYSKYSIDTIEQFIFINLDGVETSELAFSTTYKFSQVPALMAMSYVNGNIAISNILASTNDLIVTFDNVENWLLTNGLIKAITEE